MLDLRRHPRTLLLSALLLVAGLLALAVERIDRINDVFPGDAMGSLMSVAIGLAVAGLVLSRVSARR
jgi:hypothetical protein